MEQDVDLCYQAGRSQAAGVRARDETNSFKMQQILISRRDWNPNARRETPPPYPAPPPLPRREHPQLSPGYHQAGAEEAGRACAAVPGHLRGRRGGGGGAGAGSRLPGLGPAPLQRPPPRDWPGRGRGPESPEVRLTCPGGPRSALWATRLMASARSLGRRGGHR